MKKTSFLTLLFLLVFLILDYQSYYYGLGKGFFSKKIPESVHVKILFAGSDLGYQGMIIDEDDIGGVYLIRPSSAIIIEYPYNPNSIKQIFVTKILGYYFDRESFIVKILSSDNSIKHIKIIAQLYYDYYGHILLEWSQFNEKKFKYINLDKSISYFQYFKLIKNLFFVAFIVMSTLLLYKLIRKQCKKSIMANKSLQIK
jgi:hypothetical protein